MLDLQALACRLVQLLVVAYLLDDRRDLRAEEIPYFPGGCLRVLDGVVQERRADHDRIVDSSLAPEHVGQRDRMIDVGRSLEILASLVAVLLRGELQRGEDRPGRVLPLD